MVVRKKTKKGAERPPMPAKLSEEPSLIEEYRKLWKDQAETEAEIRALAKKHGIVERREHWRACLARIKEIEAKLGMSGQQIRRDNGIGKVGAQAKAKGETKVPGKPVKQQVPPEVGEEEEPYFDEEGEGYEVEFEEDDEDEDEIVIEEDEDVIFAEEGI